jgi:D-glycero-alpha-D-manno-heptose-7-phosphate kinase
MVVAMIRAFVELLNLPLDDYAIAALAFRIERIDCGLQGGRQDQYAATFGGFNFMEFSANERVIVNSLRIKNWILNELEASLVLYFTGVSRESAQIIADQSSGVVSGSVDAMKAMHGIKSEALEMKECLIRGDFVGVVKSMRQGWESKKRSAKTISNPYIDEIYESSIDSGALAGKISGAGGGGFMLFFVPTENRMSLIKNLNRFNGQASNCHFTKRGSEAWRIL